MIKSLEGGRGIAALIVAIYHLLIGTQYFSVIRYGYLFVDLFFVLSGFVMCAAYLNKLHSTQDLRGFAIRRFGRLFPLLIFSTLFYLVAANSIILLKKLAAANGYASMLNNPGALEYLIPSTAEIVSTLTLTHGMGVFDHLILNTPSWSISVEFFGYFLFAALCLFLHGKARIAAFAVCMVVGLVVSIWASVTIHDCLAQQGCLSLTYDFGFLRCIYSFFLGALTYHASRKFVTNPAMLQVAGVGLLGILLLVVGAMPAAAFAFPLAFALLIVSVCRDDGWFSDLLKRKPFQILGERSYSIYLLHMPLVLFFENIAKRFTSPAATTVTLLVYLAILIVISGWTYRFIEDPLRLKFNRIASRRQPVAAPASP